MSKMQYYSLILWNKMQKQKTELDYSSVDGIC